MNHDQPKLKQSLFLLVTNSHMLRTTESAVCPPLLFKAPLKTLKMHEKQCASTFEITNLCKICGMWMVMQLSPIGTVFSNEQVNLFIAPPPKKCRLECLESGTSFLVAAILSVALLHIHSNPIELSLYVFDYARSYHSVEIRNQILPSCLCNLFKRNTLIYLWFKI